MVTHGIFCGQAPQFIIFSTSIALLIYTLNLLRSASDKSAKLDKELAKKTGYSYDLGLFGSYAIASLWVVVILFSLIVVRMVMDFLAPGRYLIVIDICILLLFVGVVVIPSLEYKYFLIRHKEEKAGWFRNEQSHDTLEGK